jgi:hypothetical protein
VEVRTCISLKQNSASTVVEQKSWSARASGKNNNELTNEITYVFLVLYKLQFNTSELS